MNKWCADVFSEIRTCIGKVYWKLFTPCILEVNHFFIPTNCTYVQYLYMINICIERTMCI